LRDLADVAASAAQRLSQMVPDDRLAGSYPFLTLLSAAVCGWLMKRQLDALDESGRDLDPAFVAAKRAACRYYLEQVVPEAAGLAAAATAGAGLLYGFDAAAPGAL
jgi:hypothetical protein